MANNSVEQLEMRRGILDWRDKYLVLAEDCFRENLNVLFREVDEEINRLARSGLPLSSFQRRVNKNVGTLVTSWADKRISSLMTQAQPELDALGAKYQNIQPENKSDVFVSASYDNTSDTVLSLTSISAGVAAVPAIASMSTISAGGIAGLFGATIIAWPVVLVGGALAAGLMGFGLNKQRNTTQAGIAAETIKTKCRIIIRKQILCGKAASGSVCGRLQNSIRQMSDSLLDELKLC